jgi:hypothetical protein
MALNQENVIHEKVTPIKAKPKPGAKGAALPLFTTRDLHGDYRPSPYICKALLDRGDWLTVFGDSGALKTFLVIDMLLHVACGMDFCGHRVHRTGVLVIVGEGGEGMRKRIKAWLIREGIGAQDRQPWIAVTTRPASLMSDPAAIRATIAEAELAIGAPVGVVALDTLSSNFGGGDESQTSDMRTAMSNMRKACDSRAIVVVHHVGHSEKGRERGSYALRGDADRRMKVELAGHLINVTCEKAKDDAVFAPMSFRSRVVELGWLDPDGEMLTSLVLEPADYEQEEPQERFGKLQAAVMAALRVHGSGMRRADLVKAIPQHDRSNVYRAIKDLLACDVLVVVAGVIGIRGNEKP